MKTIKTQVGIVGCGPAGLLLSQLLHVRGIESVIVERQSREYVEARIRAGVLEQGTVDMLTNAGAGERLHREGLVHDGVELALNGQRQRVDFRALVGRVVTVYGQTQVTRDLVRSRIDDGTAIYFESNDVTPQDIGSTRPSIGFVHDDQSTRVECDFVAGCDGFHGVCRTVVPPNKIRSYQRDYPFAWLGILAKAPPPSDELIYSRHERGFSLCSMRSPTISRHYIQCAIDEDASEWSDDRFWEELQIRLGPDTEISDGEVFDKGVTPMRSFVCEPLRFGRLFLAGDAAHIVPPTGAKGLNLAASDVYYLSEGLIRHYQTSQDDLLDSYSARALARVWKAQRFSWWMTSLFHNFPEGFENQLRRAELEYVLGSEAALTSLAENYVGLPL